MFTWVTVVIRLRNTQRCKYMTFDDAHDYIAAHRTNGTSNVVGVSMRYDHVAMGFARIDEYIKHARESETHATRYMMRLLDAPTAPQGNVDWINTLRYLSKMVADDLTQHKEFINEMFPAVPA